jgi:hypothetical protein
MGRLKNAVCFAVMAVMAVFAVTATGALAQENSYEMRMSNRTDVYWYGVTGPGKDKSFYDPGWHILQENDLMVANTFGVGWDSRFNLTVRGTDTDQFDQERLSIQRIDWRLKKDKVTGYLGDYFANLSSYTMSRGIKGAAFRIDFADEQNYFTGAWGSFHGPWAHIYRSRDDEPMDRYGGGLRYQFARDAWTLGANVVKVEDRKNDSNRSIYEDAYEQWVGALDWEYRSDAMVLRGEHAYADTDQSPMTRPDDNLHGNANKVELMARLGILRANARYERVSPEFVSVAGGATPDRTRTYTRLDLDLTRNVRLFGLFNFNANNIENDMPVTTRDTTGEAGVRLSRLFGRPSLTSTVSLRRKWLDTTDDSRDMTSDRIKFSLADRFWRVMRVQGQFETIIDDHDNRPDKSRNYFYDFQVSSRHRLPDQNWELSPSFFVGIQERDNLTTKGSDVSETFRGQFAADYKRFFRTGFDVERSLNFFDQNTGVDSTRDRQVIFCEVMPEWLSGGRMRAEASNNDYNFDDATLGFNEKVVRFTIHFDLDKQG